MCDARRNVLHRAERGREISEMLIAQTARAWMIDAIFLRFQRKIVAD
jgi:hypothetical protein